MPIRCVAIDHEPLSLELIQYYVSLHPELQLLATFEEADKARDYLQVHKADLLIVDINTPGFAGTDFFASLPEKPQLILTTAYKKFPACGCLQWAADLLMKPIGPERFSAALKKLPVPVAGPAHAPLQGHIWVRSSYQRLRIDLHRIQYIEGREDYIRILVDNGRPVLTLMRLKAMEALLPAAEFIRIHRSYIVPIHRIKSIQARQLELSETRLPIGKTFAAAVRQLKQVMKPV